ncbi:MAG: 2-dehydro-3-deoxygalactonokinase [Burkholderiaceae bacterium]|nr:2-dehydro-3-deoxygalactonokinase [Burkholderiaceae bacterium]
MDPALLAVDWGTTALRGALLAADGSVLAEHAAPRGLLSIEPGGWAAAFEAEFGAWRRAHPTIVSLLAGMVGSRQGWAEASYCPCPAGLDDLADGLLWLQPGRLAIVPGARVENDGRPDVMRGEETQVFGALEHLGLGSAILVLPGTHSKWVRVADGRIVALATHMTGECYALLRRQSILARTLPPDDDTWVPEAFDRGVAQAQQPGGLLHHLFSVRTLALFERQGPAEAACQLSGLLIGEELRAAAPAAGSAVVVVGGAALAMRYQRALAGRGVAAQIVGAEASWLGLAALARRLQHRADPGRRAA